MALLIRTAQTAKFVSVQDPAAQLPDPTPEVWPGPDPGWLPAEGQPADACRVEIRALSSAQYAEASDLYATDAQAARAALCAAGLVSVDGQPTTLADLAYGWDMELANLISAVSARPLIGLLSRSAAGQSKVKTAGD